MYLSLRFLRGRWRLDDFSSRKVVAEPTANSWNTTVVLCHDGKSLWRSTLVTRDQGSKEEPGHSYG
jgi:hypothetical protein